MADEIWDAPNQQVVRADQSAPWDEGTGGEADEAPTVEEMTKAQLLGYAAEQGIDVDQSMTKDEIRAAIEAG
jgi:hypothetical protein